MKYLLSGVDVPGFGGFGIGAHSDDGTQVFLNDALLSTSKGAPAPVYTRRDVYAKPGDRLRFKAFDTHGHAHFLSEVRLYLPGTDEQQTVTVGTGGYIVDYAPADDTRGPFIDAEITIDIGEPDEAEKLREECDPCALWGLLSLVLGISWGQFVNYYSSRFGHEPQSLGYGWGAPFYAHVEEDVDGNLYYYDGSGRFELFLLQSGSYQPAHFNNYLKIAKASGQYTVTFPDQRKAYFDGDGKITSEVDRNGNTTTYTYTSGELSQMTDWRGRDLYFQHNGDGQPTSIREENSSTGRQTRFEYYTSGSEEGRLRYLYNPENERVEFQYDAAGRLWRIYDERGELAKQYTYYTTGDFEGRLATEVHYQERQFSSSYTGDPEGAMVRTVVEEDLTNPSTPARTTVYELDERRQLIRLTDPLSNVYEYERRARDPYQVSLQRDPNLAETSYEYNDQGNLTKVTDSQGNITRYEYTDDLGEASSNPLLSNLLRKVYRAKVTVPGSGTPVQYDPTEMVYDAAGNLVEVIDALGNSTLFNVGADGLIQDITDRRGYQTVFEYNADLMETDRKNLRRITTPGDGTDNPARTVEFRYDALYDRLIEVEDPLGNVWSTSYDDLDRPVEVTDARGKSVSFAYLDGLLDSIQLPANQGSASLTRSTNFSYDDSGRLQELLSDISSSAQQLRVRYEYDGFSNLRKLVRMMNSAQKYTQYDYDALDRTIEVQDPEHTTLAPRQTSITHAPFCTQFSVTTARGAERTSRFDTLCRLTQFEAGPEVTNYEYDQLHRLLSISQENEARYHQSVLGQSTYGAGDGRSFEYDKLDRLVKLTFEDTTNFLYEYDEESNLTQFTDALGNVTEYTYYKDNRLKEVILKRPSESDRIFTYRYDEAGRLRTLEYPASTGITANFGYLVGSTWVHGWNENGQLTYLEYRNASGRLHKFEYTYDDSGNRVSLLDTPTDLADQWAWEYRYDWLNRLSGVTRSRPNASPAVPDVVTAYFYDESDNRTQFDYEVDGETPVITTYFYNLADEITERQVDGLTAETFTHDLDGNMVGRVLSLGVATQTTTYTYDDFDRMVGRSVASPTGNESQKYRYDSDRIRKSKRDNDGTRTRFRYGGLAVANESSNSNATTFFTGHQVLGFERNGNFFYFVADGLASVRLVTNASGVEAARYNSSEFGETLERVESSSSSPQTYVGALGVRNDTASTGLLYMQQRYYDPGLGRFLNRDPIGFAGGLNLYSYVANNPANDIDPSGLLTLHGPRAAIDFFVKLQSQLTGILLHADEKGHVTAACGPVPNARPNKAARHLMGNLLASTKDIQIQLLWRDPVFFGSKVDQAHPFHEIDMFDVARYNRDCPAQHGTGAMQHELAEALAESKGHPYRPSGLGRGRVNSGRGAHGQGGRAEKWFYFSSGFPGTGPVYISPVPNPVQMGEPGGGGYLFNYGSHSHQVPRSPYAVPSGP